jgi:hypothetical protein
MIYIILQHTPNKWGWWDSNSWPLGHQDSDTMWGPKIWFILLSNTPLQVKASWAWNLHRPTLPYT